MEESQSFLELLRKDGIIELAPKEECDKLNSKLTQEQWNKIKAEGKKEPIWYRLAPRGIDLAVSMINFDYSERVLRNSLEVHHLNQNVEWLTKLLLFLTIGLLLLGFLQTIIMLYK